MAEPVGDHEVKGSLSTGVTPVGASATPQTSSGAGGDEELSREGKLRQVEKSDDLHASNTHAIENSTIVNGDQAPHDSSTGVSEDNLFHSHENAGISDSDSRADSVEQNRPEFARRDRSNSTLKKAAPFKAVSVTKNFLAKSVATAAAPAKALVDKSSSTNTSSTTMSATLKPRLVAKSGRDARSMTNGPGFRASSGPDASKVWNRNKPAPQAPQKQFTDEELKQQYGIHMATRLSADDGGKESKWADIDDDEDDWAPEAVSWTDGAKATPLDGEPNVSAEQQQMQEQARIAREIEVRNLSGSSPVQTTAGGPGKTILRPGVRNTAMQTRPGLILRSAPEPQPETSQPPPRFTAKSPWAQLPPVDKSNPVMFDPPAAPPIQDPLPGQTFRDEFGSRDEGPYSAREIAADSFKRSWDDGASRDSHLFNSQSGRYEPVRHNRRTSFRNDAQYRPASLLQRPHPNDPAQTDTSQWTARRGSSFNNESIGADNADAAAAFKGQSSAAGAFAPAENMQSDLPAPVSEEDARAAQQKAMKERIEAARKRKAEEERKEEEAKQERIKAKLASLAPLPPKNDAAKDAQVQASKTTAPIPLPSSKAEKDNDAVIHKNSALLSSEAHFVAKPSSSEDFPPPLSSIHDQSSIQPPSGSHNTQTKPSFTSSPPQDKFDQPKSFVHGASLPAQNQLTPPKSPRQPFQDSSLIHSHVTSQSHENSQNHQLDRSTAGWNAIPQNHLTSGWASQLPAAGNVWGSPSNDKQLGNGAFDSGLATVSLPQSQGQQRETSQGPGPIAPPSRSRLQNQSSPEEFGRPTNTQNRQPQQNMPSLNRSGRRDPFSRPPPNASNMNPAMAAWNNLPAQLAKDEKAQYQAHLKIVDEIRAGERQVFQPALQETYRQIDGETGRKTTHVVETVHPSAHINATENAAPTSNVKPLAQTGLANVPVVTMPAPLSSGLATPQAHSGQLIQPGSKSSRFFGPGADKSASTSPPQVRSDVLDGPPPETSSHPAFSGPGNPLVKLPTPVKVKLPPTSSSATQSKDAVIMPNNLRPRFGTQPIAATTDWQHRFDGLFNNTGRRSGAAATSQLVQAQMNADLRPANAAAVKSSSKAPLDHPSSSSVASVSLPPSQNINPADRYSLDASNAQSKLSEGYLFEEPAFGSLPIIKLGKLSKEQQGLKPSSKRAAVRIPQETGIYYAHTAQTFNVADESLDEHNNYLIRIKLSSQQKVSIKTLPSKVARKGRFNHHNNNKKYKGRNAGHGKRANNTSRQAAKA